jgi:large repetitive protein
MKKLLQLIFSISFLVMCFNAKSQSGDNCANAAPFCTGTSYNFPNNTGVASLGGAGAYGCLGSTPNPVWYFMEILNPGNLDITINQGPTPGSTGQDVDFVCWGPFANQSVMCSGYSAGNIIDCSYSTASTEVCNITGASTGQFYLMLLTNYSNSSGYISFTNTGGAATTNCAILCNMTALTATPGACNAATGQYSVTGSITVSYPPTTGTLTVTSSCGGSVTYNPPFTSPINYTLPGITANGAACSITASFSADATCTLNKPYTAPAPCNTCTATATNTGAYCAGATIQLNSTGGGTYSWAGPGGFSSTAQNPTRPTSTTAMAGTYTVTVTNGAATCTATTTVVVNPKPVITAPANISQCAGTSVAAQSFTSTPAGATYAWTNSNTAIGLAASGAGSVSAFTGTNTTSSPITATITVTPTLAGCVGTPITYTITINPQPTSTFTQSANQCLTGNSFSFTNTGLYGSSQTWTFTGGTPGTSTAVSPTGVTYAAAGTYSVTHVVTATGGCTSTTTSTVTIYPMPTGLTATTGPATCGSSNGTITITNGIGGTSPYTYSVNGGAFSGTLSYTGQSAGSHTIIVKDANGCTYTTTVNVATSSGPTALAVTTVNSTCGASNGIINIGATTGGSGPYTYSVNASAYTGTTSYTGFAAGTYTVIVKDGNGCTFTTSATVTNTPGPTAQATSTTNSTCGTSNGTVTIGATTGGTSPYTYSFNGSAYTTTTNYTGLAAGTYTVIVHDANNCSFTVNPVVVNSPGPTALVVTTTNSTCGNSNGAINIGAVTGGTSAYTYSVAGGAYSGTTSYTGFAAGSYSVVVKDANGCTFTTSATVVNSPGPTAIAITTGNSSCGTSNGSITLGAVTGGVPAYTYSVNASAFSGTTSYTGFAAGPYTVIVKDANGCTFTTTATVNNSSGPTALVVNSTNANCGISNGTVTIGAVTGGLSPYTYSYNGGAYSGTTNYTGQAAGTYNVSVKDANGCTYATTVTVNNTPGPTALVSTTTNSTCGASNGVVTIGAVTGGTPTYTYSFNASAYTSTTNYTNLAAGTYTVTVKDANGCTFTINPVVSNTPGPTAQATSTTNSTCGLSNGTLTIGATTGGTLPYTYSFNASAYGTTTNYTNLTAGTYTVIVKDANGCTFTVNPVLSNTPGPTAQATTTTNATCGNANGTLNIGATTGGTPPYTYSFDGGGFTSTTNYTGLTSGPHAVIVKDANGCTFTINPNVGSTPGPTAIVRNTTSSTCGGTNGVITLGAVTGGTAPYTYSVGGSSFTSTTSYTGLAANTYPVIVQDANGCQFTTSATITDLSGLTASITAQINVSCNGGANGSVTVTASGSAAPYSYAFGTGTYGSSGTFNGLAAGSYTVTAKDGNGCTLTVPVTINQPSILTGVINSQTNINCFGANNGSVTISAGGGVSPYTYSIDGGGFTASATFSNLSAGAHTAVVKDANGCTVNVPVNITQPTALTLVTSSVNAICTAANGSATVVVSGATPNYSYLWTPGGAITATASNIAAGNYSVLVTDANGCTQTANINVGSSPGGPAVISSTSNVTCTGANNGSSTVSMGAGSTPPYGYSWNPSNQTTATANNLAPGSYVVTVTDGNGCIATASTVITEPAIITNAFTNVNVTCNGGNNGSSTANPAGGTAPYSYFWSVGQSSQIATGLNAGTYTCVITDANNCTKTVTTTITEPAAMVLTPGHTDANCNQPNGTATVSVTGGVGTYTYAWNTNPVQTTQSVSGLAANTYAVTVMDGNGCTQTTPVTVANLAGPTATLFSSTNVSCNGLSDGNATVTVTGGTSPYTYQWSNAQSLPTATNLAAGTYVLTATDFHGCVASTSATITEPLALNVSTVSTNPSCATICDGSIASVPTGGTSPYSYLWTPGSATTQNISNLCDGDYMVQVTDAHGCIVYKNITISDPAPVTASTTVTNITCSGLCNGTATANPLSGTGPFTYSWSGASAQTTQTATGLCLGSYTVTVSDANGCSGTATATITSPGALTVNITSFGNVTCYAGTNGYATAATIGGTSPITYAWNPTLTSGSSVNNLVAGSYTVTATDANGCSASTTQAIIQPNPIVGSIIHTDVTCYGACDGQATAAYTGGTGQYTFVWTPALQTTPVITGLCDGIQNLTLTDSLGCSITNSVVILQPTILAVTTTTTNSDCGTGNGTACAQITGGSPPFVYAWSDPNTQAVSCATGLNAGVYTISVTDSHNCSVTATANLNDNGAPVVTIPTSSDVTCAGAANGSAQANITGGILPYTTSWTTNPAQTNTFANGLAGGTYSFIVTDSVGCTGSAQIMINEPTPLLSTIISPPTSTSCYLTCDAQLTVQAGGGTAPYAYAWNDVNTQNTATASNLCAQGYTVTTTDANGCISTTSTTVTQPPAINIAAVTQNVSCNAGTTGSINLTVTGGTPFYTYSWSPSVGTNPVTNLPAGTYTVTVTDTKQCPQTATYTISEPTPMVLSPNSVNSTCGNANGGVSVGVVGGTPNATTPFYSYSWTGGATTSLVTGLAASTYTVTVTDANSCTATASSTISNTAGPTITGTSFNSPSCNGFTNGNATVIATGGTPSYNYSWSTVPVQSGPSPSAVGLTAGVYTVTVSDQNTCTATATVNVLPIAPLAPISLPSQTICLGQSATIYSAFSGGTTPYTYSWNPSSVGTGQGPFLVTPSTPGTTVPYTVTVSDAHSCIATQTINIIVNPLLVASTTPASGCAGKPISLTATAVGGAGAPYTFSWSPATDLNTASGPSVISTPAIASGTVNYVVSVTDNGGCSSTTTTQIVNVNPSPIAFITPGPLSGCEPFTTTFGANSSPAGTYSWNFGDGSANETGSAVSHTYASSVGSPYNVTLTTTTADGCIDSVKLTPLYPLLVVNPSPTAGFTTSPSSTTITSPLVLFTDQSVNADSIHWDFYYTDPVNGLYTSTEQNPTFTYADTGSYVVQQIVYNQYGCQDEVTHTVDILPEYILYAPNAFTPFNHDGINDVFMPSGVGIDPDNFEMTIFDRWGNLIFKTTDLAKGWDGKANGGQNVAQIDVYVWKIKTKDYKGDNHFYVGHVTIVK